MRTDGRVSYVAAEQLGWSPAAEASRTRRYRGRRPTRQQLAELAQLLDEPVTAKDPTAEPAPVELAPPARPFRAVRAGLHRIDATATLTTGAGGGWHTSVGAVEPWTRHCPGHWQRGGGVR